MTRNVFFFRLLHMFDDDEPRKTEKGLNRNLELLSVNELEAYIEELKLEIKRAEEDIEKKKNVFSEADKFFK